MMILSGIIGSLQMGDKSVDRENATIERLSPTAIKGLTPAKFDQHSRLAREGTVFRIVA